MYFTTDPSPYEGRKFHRVEGTAAFAPEETCITVKVPILNDDRYDPTLEFSMTLSEPASCELGLYLYKCRIKIIDDDVPRSP